MFTSGRSPLGVVRGWDLRKLSAPVMELHGHSGAVTAMELVVHPRDGRLRLVSASNDWTARVWNVVRLGFRTWLGCKAVK